MSPGAPEASESLAGIGLARFAKGDFAASLEPLESARATLTDWPPIYWTLTAAYALLDRLDDARQRLEQARVVAPNLSLAGIQIIVDRSDGRLGTLIEGLRKVGLR